MQPAKNIIQRLGGESVVADVTGTGQTSPYRWQYGKEKGGTGGWIPRKHHSKLIEYARQIGVDLSAADFLLIPSSGEINGTSGPDDAHSAGRADVASSRPNLKTLVSPATDAGLTGGAVDAPIGLDARAAS